MRLPQGVREIRGANFRKEAYPYSDVTEKVIGCAIRVHRALRAGFVEGIYENALTHELAKARIRVSRQVRLPVYYDGALVGEHVADLIVEGKVAVELKAVADLTAQHRSQLMSTMMAAGLEVGLLINFHEARLVDGIQRIVMQKESDRR